jgi:hypothetical protein
MQIEQLSYIKALVMCLKSAPVLRRSLSYDYIENIPSATTLNHFITLLSGTDILVLTSYEHAVPKSKIPIDDPTFPSCDDKLNTNGNFIK